MFFDLGSVNIQKEDECTKDPAETEQPMMSHNDTEMEKMQQRQDEWVAAWTSKEGVPSKHCNYKSFDDQIAEWKEFAVADDAARAKAAEWAETVERQLAAELANKEAEAGHSGVVVVGVVVAIGEVAIVIVGVVKVEIMEVVKLVVVEEVEVEAEVVLVVVGVVVVVVVVAVVVVEEVVVVVDAEEVVIVVVEVAVAVKV